MAVQNGNGKLEQKNGVGSCDMKCSMCGKHFDPSQSKTMPFCSKRCQQIDLGHWLNEGYGLPVESGEATGMEEEYDQND